MKELRTYQPSLTMSLEIIKAATIGLFIALSWASFVALGKSIFDQNPTEIPKLDLSSEDVFLIVIVSPFIESLLLRKLINAFQRHNMSHLKCCVYGGAIWGALHMISDIGWGIVTTVSFTIMTSLYIKFRVYSQTSGLVVIWLMHTMLNTLSVLLLWNL